MIDALDAWIQEIEEQRDQGVQTERTIHLDELDPRMRDPARWGEGMLELASAAGRLVTERRLPWIAAVGLMISPPFSDDDVQCLQMHDLLQRRTRTPPLLYLAERGEEPWTRVAWFSQGGMISSTLGTMDLYVCRWWDSDEGEPAGAAWVHARGRHSDPASS